MYYERVVPQRESGVAFRILSFGIRKMMEGFHNSWRGASYMALAFLFWHSWPDQKYWNRIFEIRDLRSAADVVDSRVAILEVNKIREQILILDSQNAYTSHEAYGNLKRLMWLERRAESRDLSDLVISARRLQDEAILRHWNPQGQG